MFDNTPLDSEGLIDQCRALAYAVVEVDNLQACEILMFILQERINHLYLTYQTDISDIAIESAEVRHV